MSDLSDLDAVWTRVAALSELDPDFPILVVVEGTELAVGIAEGDVFAVENVCSHAYARLSDGYVQGREIFCPLHHGSFDVRTGAAVASPCFEPIRCCPVKTEDDAVLVDVSALRKENS